MNKIIIEIQGACKVEDKIMLASGLYKHGVIHQAYVHEGKTVISEFYEQMT